LAPNVSEARHGFPVYGLGQPTMNGIADFVQALKDGGKQVCHIKKETQSSSVWYGFFHSFSFYKFYLIFASFFRF